MCTPVSPVYPDRAPTSPGIVDILRRYLPEYLCRHSITLKQYRVLRAILSCRTKALGGHTLSCQQCGHQTQVYNSCGDRHCPTCQGKAGRKWVARRITEILPVHHYHIVFTLPHLLNPIIQYNRKKLFDLLFYASAETLKVFSEDPKHLGARPGFFGILHTWSQALVFHPHIHYLFPAGGLDLCNHRWVPLPNGGRFLFPVKALSKLFRGIFIQKLKQMYYQGQLIIPDSSELSDSKAFEMFLDQVTSRKWEVYAKPPFSGPEKVILYIGRYTHRVAISNRRIISVKNGMVTFTCRPNRKDSQQPGVGFVRLPVFEFIKRYLEHILPDHYHKIRFFGFMANGCRTKNLQIALHSIIGQNISIELDDQFIQRFLSRLLSKEPRCPFCQTGVLVVSGMIHAEGFFVITVPDTS